MRNRIKYQNEQTEIPSVHQWQTPKRMMSTTGLRAAVCDLVIKTSISKTQAGICKRVGERNLLSTQTVLNILHETGQALIESRERRARAVYEEIPEAKCFIIDPAKPWRKREPILSDELS